jgi:hypothetical protein
MLFATLAVVDER